MEMGRKLLFSLMLLMVIGRGGAQLSLNFYSVTCPNVEAIVRQVVATKFSQTFVTVPATLRLFFHDCFVEVNILCPFALIPTQTYQDFHHVLFRAKIMHLILQKIAWVLEVHVLSFNKLLFS